MEVFAPFAERVWARFGKIASIILVAGIAMGMTVSVVALFGQASTNQQLTIAVANIDAEANMESQMLWKELSYPSSGLLSSDRVAIADTQRDLSAIDPSSSMAIDAVIHAAKADLKVNSEVLGDFQSGNFAKASRLLRLGDGRSLLSLTKAVRTSENLQNITASRTAKIADGEILAMMAFAAIMTVLLFRKFSFAKLASELRGAQERASAQARFRSVVVNSSDVLVVLDYEFKILYFTPSFERSLGYPLKDLLSHSFLDYVSPEDHMMVLSNLQSPRSNSGSVITSRWLHRDGTIRSMESTSSNLLEDPDVKAIVINARDVTERLVLEEQLMRSAFHDSLTGLPNRALLYERLGSAIRRLRGDEGVGLLFIDLDDFKAVNDSFGHGAGDELLRQVAVRLSENVESDVTVSRLAGDEFAIVLEGLSSEEELVDFCRCLVEELARPYELSQGSYAAGASIGATLIRSGELTPDEVMRQGDVAMYVAKKDLRSHFAIFDESMQESILERLRIKADLKVALAEDALSVYYQPVVDLDTGEVVGVEALVRWIHPERGLLAPIAFVPIAEESDMIIDLGAQVLRKACQQMAQWNRRRRGKPLTLNVNLSVKELQEEDLVDRVAEVLSTSGMDPALLTLELTETVLISHPEKLVVTLHALHDLGVRIAIDDFGTGYSSLSYLENLPVDSLKIDKSFTDHLLSDEPPVTLRTIVQLGNDLNLKIVAEGIEEARQASSLVALGCNFGQGFHFAKPLATTDLEALLFPYDNDADRTASTQRFRSTEERSDIELGAKDL